MHLGIYYSRNRADFLNIFEFSIVVFEAIHANPKTSLTFLIYSSLKSSMLPFTTSIQSYSINQSVFGDNSGYKMNSFSMVSIESPSSTERLLQARGR